MAKWRPPPGKTYVGVLAQAHAEYDYFENNVSPFAWTGAFGVANMQQIASSQHWQVAVARGTPIHWTFTFLRTPYSATPSGQASCRAVAQGFCDAHILNQFATFASAGVPVLIRPFHEFTGAWGGVYTWQSWPGTGNPAQNLQRLANSNADFIAAFRRLHILINRAGRTLAQANALLVSLGMPVVQGGASSLPTRDFDLCWCPHRAPNPSPNTHAGQNPHQKWPGAAYVDWVGTDAYSIFSWSSVINAAYGPNEFYDQYCAPGTVDADGTVREKPFAWTELGTRGANDGSWHTNLFNWVEARINAAAVFYFMYDANDGDSLIFNYPAVQTVWQNRTQSSRYLRNPADVQDYGGGGPTEPPVTDYPDYGYPTVGALSANIGANWTYGMVCEAPQALTVGSVRIGLRARADAANDASQPVKVRLHAFTDVGEPGAVLATSPPTTVTEGDGPALVDVTIPPTALTAGQRFLISVTGGPITGDTSPVAQLLFDEPTVGTTGAFFYGLTAGSYDGSSSFGQVDNELARLMTALVLEQVVEPPAGDEFIGGPVRIDDDPSVTVEADVAGTDRLVLAGVASPGATTLSGVTNNADAMSLVDREARGSACTVELWKLASPDVGTATDTVFTWPGDVDAAAGTLMLEDAHGTLGTPAAANGDGLAASVSVAADAGDRIVACLSWPENGLVAEPDQGVEVWSSPSGLGSAAGLMWSFTAASDGVTQMSATFTGTPPGTAPTLRARGTVASATAKATNATGGGMPSGWQAGDRHLLFVQVNRYGTLIAPPTVATPSGWTPVISTVVGGDGNNGATNGRSTRIYLFERVAEGGDSFPNIQMVDNGAPGTYLLRGQIVGYQGVASVDFAQATASAANTASLTAAGGTTLGANRTVAAFMSAADNNTASSPTLGGVAMSNLANSITGTGAEGGFAYADLVVTSAAATGDLAATYDGADPWAGVVVGLAGTPGAADWALTAAAVKPAAAVVDTTPPLPASGLVLTESPSGSARLTFTASVSLDTVAYKVRQKTGLDQTFSSHTDGSSFAGETVVAPGVAVGPLTVAGYSSDAQVTVCVFSKDASGNWDAGATADLTFADRNAPASPTSVTATEPVLGSARATFTMPATADASRYLIRQKNGTGQSFSGPTDGTEFTPDAAATPSQTVTADRDGYSAGASITVGVFAGDAAGNWSAAATASITFASPTGVRGVAGAAAAAVIDTRRASGGFLPPA